MSDEGFLARWSRRKRAAPVRAEAPSHPQQEAAKPTTEAADPAAEPAIDVADLPPIESIGPGADVRAFLMPGVPATVARAALRRAWSADPAIRDFVGLSENSWDFTAAGGVPGFGSVSLEDAKRLLDRLAADPDAEMPEQDTAVQAQADRQSRAPIGDAEALPHRGNGDRGDRPATGGRAAPQTEPEIDDSVLRRRLPRHGGALPE